VIIHLDTSVLVDALCGPRRLLPTLIQLTDRGERPVVSTIVLYEWLRGPRARGEIALQEELFPRDQAVAFGAAEAAAAARIYTSMKRARGREADIAIAACALVHGGALWTLNPGDFQDIPDLRLV
jgi:predicted nucleic acid-binding protein